MIIIVILKINNLNQTTLIPANKEAYRRMRSEETEQDRNCPSTESVYMLLQRYCSLSAFYGSLTSSIFLEASPSELTFCIPGTNDGNKSKWQCRACFSLWETHTEKQKFRILHPGNGTSPESSNRKTENPFLGLGKDMQLKNQNKSVDC